MPAETVRMLGYWCKTLKFAREVIVAEASKQAGKLAGKYFSREVTKLVSYQVGKRIVAKYGGR